MLLLAASIIMCGLVCVGIGFGMLYLVGKVIDGNNDE